MKSKLAFFLIFILSFDVAQGHGRLTQPQPRGLLVAALEVYESSLECDVKLQSLRELEILALEVHHDNDHLNCRHHQAGDVCNTKLEKCYLKTEKHEIDLNPDHVDTFCCVKGGVGLQEMEDCWGMTGLGSPQPSSGRRALLIRLEEDSECHNELQQLAEVFGFEPLDATLANGGNGRRGLGRVRKPGNGRRELGRVRKPVSTKGPSPPSPGPGSGRRELGRVRKPISTKGPSPPSPGPGSGRRELGRAGKPVSTKGPFVPAPLPGPGSGRRELGRVDG